MADKKPEDIEKIIEKYTKKYTFDDVVDVSSSLEILESGKILLTLFCSPEIGWASATLRNKIFIDYDEEKIDSYIMKELATIKDFFLSHSKPIW